MSESAFHPEDKARSLIDRRLVTCGWLIQSKEGVNLGAGLGVAVREFQTASGPVDYGLFVGRKLCGVIDAAASRWLASEGVYDGPASHHHHQMGTILAVGMDVGVQS